MFKHHRHIQRLQRNNLKCDNIIAIIRGLRLFCHPAACCVRPWYMVWFMWLQEALACDGSFRAKLTWCSHGAVYENDNGYRGNGKGCVGPFFPCLWAT